MKIYYSLFLLCLSAAALLLSAPSAHAANEATAQSAPLVMGVFPRRSAKVTFKLFKPLANYLSKQLGRDVELRTAADFASFWEGVKRRDYDLVHYNQYHYLVSRRDFGYRVILRNEEAGYPTLAGTLVVRKDSGIKTLQDLKGKKIVFGGGKKAMMSYIAVRYLLQEAGLHHGDYIEAFAKNPPNAMFSVYHHQSDAAGCGDAVMRLKMVKERINTDELTYLLQGEQLPHLPWAVKDNLPDDLATKIQRLLADLKDSKEGRNLLKQARLTALLPAVDADFEPHRAIIEAVYGSDYR